MHPFIVSLMFVIYVAAIQVPVSGSGGGVMVQQTPQGPRLVMPQRTGVTAGGTASIGTGGLQLLQTSTGQLLLTTAPVQKPTNPTLSHGQLKIWHLCKDICYELWYCVDENGLLAWTYRKGEYI